MRNKETVEEILRRADILRRERAKEKRIITSVAAVTFCLLFVAGLSVVMSGVVSSGVAPESAAPYSGSLFAGAAVGGYVLIGVIAFVLGVAVTIFCMRLRDKANKGDGK